MRVLINQLGITETEDPRSVVLKTQGKSQKSRRNSTAMRPNLSCTEENATLPRGTPGGFCVKMENFINRKNRISKSHIKK